MPPSVSVFPPCAREWKPASARDVSEQIYDRLTGKQTPIQYLVTDLADSFSSLTNFVLGLYVSLVLGSIYYAQRGMLGTAFSRVLGFTMHLVSSVTPAPALQGTGAPGPSGIPRAAPPVPAHIQAAKRRMVRWVNAVFRLLWLECCGYDGQIDDSIHVMDGSLGPLLTPKEWRRIRNLPSRATHIIHWANTAVIDLCSEGYLTPNGSAELRCVCGVGLRVGLDPRTSPLWAPQPGVVLKKPPFVFVMDSP